ncbi:MAG: hypothetical protein ACYCQK_04935 [Acidiferrobacteraceae bacterium]
MPRRRPNTKETTIIKAIEGQHAFYVVQVAWKGDIPLPEMSYWGYYIRDVVVSPK